MIEDVVELTSQLVAIDIFGRKVIVGSQVVRRALVRRKRQRAGHDVSHG